jgi:hypothetical protein
LIVDITAFAIIAGSLGGAAAAVFYLTREPHAPKGACPMPPTGWSCTREPGHEGPCAAVHVSPPWADAPAPTNTNLPVLTDAQARVLRAMSGDIGYTALRLSEFTSLQAAAVGKVRKELRDMGLVRYGPLFDEDGAGIRGSGYTLTEKGANVRAALIDLGVAA